VPKVLRYLPERDVDLQGAALRLFPCAVASCLRARSPGSGSTARFGSAAFDHRSGSSLDARLHFHCAVIDGVFDAAAVGEVIFRAATGLEANAIAQVQAQVRRRLLRVFVRRGLLGCRRSRAMAVAGKCLAVCTMATAIARRHHRTTQVPRPGAPRVALT
jgi:hypothetical protein